jgi:hypothetical protein
MSRTKKGSGVSVNVPGRPVGRLIDSLTNMISPFSQAQALKADRIRLQREEVAIEIAKRARERLAIKKQPIHPIPNKILVPLLEAASNEEIEDTYMVDMWAKLLASAATDSKVEPRYISILKELRKEQAELLLSIARFGWDHSPSPFMELESAPRSGQPTSLRTAVLYKLVNEYHKIRTGSKPDMEYVTEELMLLSSPGFIVASVIQEYKCYSDEAIANMKDHVSHYEQTEIEASALSLEILSSLGLCRRTTEYFEGPEAYDVTIECWFITELGIAFLSSCVPDLCGDAEDE